MAGQSARWGFLKLNDLDDYLEMQNRRFVWADRDLLDKILTYAENHTHDGRSSDEGDPEPPTVSESEDVGMIPAGTVVYYRAARVDDRGQQHRSSGMVAVTTPPQIPSPDAPMLTKTNGSLLAGEYQYAISAFTGISKAETRVSSEAVTFLTRAGGVTLTMPDPPSGADGFNIYRKAPGERELCYVTNVPVDTDWTDDGSYQVDLRHRVPGSNRTNSYNAFDVAFDVAAGESWDLYRTYDPTDWEDSFVERSTGTITDLGVDTQPGMPPVASGLVGSPPKIQLADVAEVEGRLPSGLLTFTDTVNFMVEEPVVGHLEWFWLCEYNAAEIFSVRATLGRDAYPSAQRLTVTIERSVDDGLTWEDVLSGGVLDEDPVSVLEGEFIGPLSTVTHWSLVNVATWPHFDRGDRMRMTITQDGGGATPTDYELNVNVLLYCTYGASSFTYEMGSGINLNNILLDEDGNPLLDEDGNFLLWG